MMMIVVLLFLNKSFKLFLHFQFLQFQCNLNLNYFIRIVLSLYKMEFLQHLFFSSFTNTFLLFEPWSQYRFALCCNKEFNFGHSSLNLSLLSLFQTGILQSIHFSKLSQNLNCLLFNCNILQDQFISLDYLYF